MVKQKDTERNSVRYITLTEPTIDGKPAPQSTGIVRVEGYDPELKTEYITRGDFAKSLSYIPEIKDFERGVGVLLQRALK